MVYDDTEWLRKLKEKVADKNHKGSKVLKTFKATPEETKELNEIADEGIAQIKAIHRLISRRNLIWAKVHERMGEYPSNMGYNQTTKEFEVYE